MSSTDQSPPLETVLALQDLTPVVDERTLRIVDRRRRSIHHRGWLMTRALLAADVLAFTGAFVAAQVMFLPSGAVEDPLGLRTEAFAFLVALPLWLLVAALYGLYRGDQERIDHTTMDEFLRIVQLVTIGAWGLWLGSELSGVASPEAGKIAVFWLLAIVLVTTFRAVGRTACRRSTTYIQNAVIVGAGEIGQLVARKLALHAEYGINLVGFVDRDPKARRPDIDQLTVLGPPERIPAIVRAFDVERAIIAFSHENSHESTLELVRSLKDLNVHVDIVPRLFEVVSSVAALTEVEGLPLLGLRPPRLSRSGIVVKRAIDILVATLGLLFFSPVLIALGILIKCESRGPVLFRQSRVGAKDRPFRIFKFRTMVQDAEERKAELHHLNRHVLYDQGVGLFKVPGDPRVTRIGRFLRTHALDELPQLLNVLKGDMSLVGPRPLVLPEDAQVPTWARRRLDLKPGMTGLWQALGGSGAISFQEMLALDYLYVTTWSPWGDLVLLARTLRIVLKGAGGDY